MSMRLLYPSDPVNAKIVEETYGEEYEAAARIGTQISIFSLEEFERGIFRARPAVSSAETIIYRGWMLTDHRYQDLVSAIESEGAAPFTSAAAYRECHHLPGWYPALREFTAETVVLPEYSDFASAMAGIDWPGYFVKDYVKSLNTAGGSLVPTPQHIGRIVELLRRYRGFIEGGICIRKREDYIPGSERRYFIFKGVAHSVDGQIPPVVARCAASISSPFYCVDTAILTDGTVRIVELGDGQVSDRKEWIAERFVELFASRPFGFSG